LFTGRRLDILDGGSLKLQYNRNRYYDPETGRWLTHDPLGITPNPPKPNFFDAASQYIDGMNLYEYVGSAAPMALDAAGLRWFCRDKCITGYWRYTIADKPVIVRFPGTPKDAEIEGRLVLGGKIAGWGLWAGLKGVRFLTPCKLPSLNPTASIPRGKSFIQQAQETVIELDGMRTGWRIFWKLTITSCCQELCGGWCTEMRWRNVWKKKEPVLIECVGDDEEPKWVANPLFGEEVGPILAAAPGNWRGKMKEAKAKAKACKEELDKALRTAMSAKKGASSTDEICVIKTDKCKAKKD